MNFLSNKSFIAWYFVLPVVFIHLFVIGIPSILSLALCLRDWSGLGKINYVGFENFIELFDDRYFKKAIFHNILWTIIFLTVPVCIALMCAYLLTGIKRGQMFYRLAFFFPYISDIRSVTRKVIGYGRIPTESSNNFKPKTSNSNGCQKKNF